MSVLSHLIDWSSNCLRSSFLSNVFGPGAVDFMHAKNCCSLYEFGGCLEMDRAVGLKTLTAIGLNHWRSDMIAAGGGFDGE